MIFEDHDFKHVELTFNPFRMSTTFSVSHQKEAAWRVTAAANDWRSIETEQTFKRQEGQENKFMGVFQVPHKNVSSNVAIGVIEKDVGSPEA
jgi:hypothetical protein